MAASVASNPAFADLGFAWSLEEGQDRRDFVHVLRLLDALGVLRKVEGDEERYLRDQSADVLFNVVRPVLASLLAVRRSPSLVTEDSFETRIAALADTDLPDSPDARNRALRIFLPGDCSTIRFSITIRFRRRPARTSTGNGLFCCAI